MRQILRFAKSDRFRRRLFLVTLAVGLLCIFRIPYFVPVPLAWSDSYLFGYNNRTGEGLFLLLAVLLGLIAKFGGMLLPDETRGERGTVQLSHRLLITCLTISTLVALGLYLLTHSVGGLADGAYFLDRIHLIERGQTPYRNFEFVYGSFSLYASVFLGRVLAIGATNGYYLLWLAETLLGVWFLWIFLRWIDIPGGGARRVFLITYALTLFYLTSIALNYCALRYTLPLFGIVALCRVDQGAGIARRAATVGMAVLVVTVLLGLSPEEGIAFACATVMYLPLRRYFSRRPWMPDLLVLIPALVLVYLVAAHAGVFGTMKGFAAGAFNLPIYPAPHILFAFAAILGLVCYLATGNFRQRVQSNVCFVVIYGLGMVPGALGRCDTTHVGGYEMGILLCFLLLCWRWPVAWQVATWCFALFFLILPFALGRALLAACLHEGISHTALPGRRAGERVRARPGSSRDASSGCGAGAGAWTGENAEPPRFHRSVLAGPGNRLSRKLAACRRAAWLSSQQTQQLSESEHRRRILHGYVEHRLASTGCTED